MSAEATLSAGTRESWVASVRAGEFKESSGFHTEKGPIRVSSGYVTNATPCQFKQQTQCPPDLGGQVSGTWAFVGVPEGPACRRPALFPQSLRGLCCVHKQQLSSRASLPSLGFHYHLLIPPLSSHLQMGARASERGGREAE